MATAISAPVRSLARSLVRACPALPCPVGSCLPMQECRPPCSFLISSRRPHARTPARPRALAAAADCAHTHARFFASPRPLPCFSTPSLACIAPIMACPQRAHVSITSHRPPRPPRPRPSRPQDSSLPPRLHALGALPARRPSALRPVSLYHLLYPSQTTRPASHLSHPPLPV
jgi:hypothetical protein